MEKAKEITTEVKQEVKEATTSVATEVAAKVRPMVQSVSLRETIAREGFDAKRGWRRILALLGATSTPFYR